MFSTGKQMSNFHFPPFGSTHKAVIYLRQNIEFHNWVLGSKEADVKGNNSKTAKSTYIEIVEES